MSNNNADKYRYLFKNIMAFLCGNLGTKLISFLMIPLYTNVLLPVEYGEIDLILSVAGVLSPFVACGIHEGIMRFALDKDADYKLVLSIGLRVFFVSSLIFLLLCPLISVIPMLPGNVFFLYLYCILNELMTICLCYIRGRDKVKLYSFCGFLSAFFSASLNIFFLVILKWGLLGYKISMLISPVFTMIAAILTGRISRDISVKRWDKGLAVQMLKYSLILIPNAILWWGINASDRFFVSYMCGKAENGIYAVSYKIPTLLNVAASIFTQSWQMSAIKEYEEGGEAKFYNQVYRLLTFFVGCATIILILANRQILSVYVGEEYQGAWLYSPPLMVAFFTGSLGTFWGSFYIAAKNMKKYLQSAIAGAIVNLILNFILIYSMGTIGAAIATMFSYFVVMIVRALGIQKEVHVTFMNRQFVSSMICLMIGLISAYFPAYLSWGVGVLNILFYVLINRKEVIFLMKLFKTVMNKIRGKG